MSEEKLEPCPFCGKDAKPILFSSNISELQSCKIDCSNPRCISTFPVRGRVEEARRLWNSRPIEDALRARVAELEAENAEANYIIKQFESWESGENGCPRMNDIDFTCEEEERFKPDMNYPCFEPEFCEDEDGCWVTYYRWKYRQKQEKKAGE